MNQALKWTQDDAIAFECARDCITHLIAIRFAELYRLEQEPDADKARTAELYAEIGKLTEERANLGVLDHEEIRRIREEYGQVVRANAGAAPAKPAETPDKG